MKTRGWPGFAAMLLCSILLLVTVGQASAQERRSPSADEQLRQAEGQLLRIAAEHRQAEKAASNRWKWIAGGVIAAGLTAGAVVVVRRCHYGRWERRGKASSRDRQLTEPHRMGHKVVPPLC